MLKTLEKLGFETVRSGNHIAMVRNNPDGSRTPLNCLVMIKLRVPHLELFADSQELLEKNSWKFMIKSNFFK